jgi:hypothetical protein
MTYIITAEFSRDLSDDQDIAAETFPNLERNNALIQQFRKELQAGYDDAGIAGVFNITGINLPGPYDNTREPRDRIKAYRKLERANRELLAALEEMLVFHDCMPRTVAIEQARAVIAKIKGA